MDCCNFVPYRSPYYGTPSYYDGFPYPQDYYGHHYQDYYHSYYQQPWQCAPFTDYVYNPKEARIRKAMREASRERAMGIAPMVSTRAGVRRTSTPSNTWNFNGEEQLLMNPPHGMRGVIGSPMCGSPGFSSVSSSGNGSFMPAMHYAKHVHPMPQHSQESYMQTNPMGQIPPQSEIWHSYDGTIRSNSTGPYMLHPPQSYHQPQIESPPMLARGKPKVEVDVFPAQEEAQPQQNNENQIEKLQAMSEPIFENKVDSIQPLEPENVPGDSYLSSFNDSGTHRGGNFENKDEIKVKKFSIKSSKFNAFKPSTKPLPDFNEAFGSTERGRFQRLPNNKGYLDYFMQHENDIKFLDFHL